MGILMPVAKELPTSFDPHAWMGMVLEQFARAEQALGELSLALELPITNGSLGSLGTLRSLLVASGEKRATTFNNRIERWSRNRPYRHLLAHATTKVLFDKDGQQYLLTRHLPKDSADVSRDRLWTFDEQKEILRQVTSDSRAICDHVRNLIGDPKALAKLRKT